MATDYSDLIQKHGGHIEPSGAPVDYQALIKKHGGVVIGKLPGTKEPPQKPGWWSRTRSFVQSHTEPTTYFPGAPTSMYDPALGEMELNTIKRTGRVLFGIADFLPQAWVALKDAMSDDPEKAADGESRLLSMHPGAQMADRVKELRDDYRRDPKLAGANVAGDVAGMWLAGKAMEMPFKAPESLSGLRETLADRYGPRSVEIAGERVPVAVGEAAPESKAGKVATRLKRAGVSGERWERLQREQLARVKRILRNTAQSTSGLIGPMADEPAGAMSDAAETTFAKARPMYRALDGALRNTPASLAEITPVIKTAIAKARQLGAVINPEAELVFDGKKITPANNPVLWQRLVEQGIVNEAGEGTPLTAVMKIRSQLLRMQRAASDPAMRNAIGNEVRELNDNIEGALKGTPHYENWLEANRLWSKGFAIRDVADAIRKSTKGTPQSEQAPGLTSIPTELRGSELVRRLNQLADSGVLDKAFTPEEAANLRQSADLLDRIQRTPIGKGLGESITSGRGLAHALRDTGKSAGIGTGLGFAVGGIHGAEVGAGLGLLVQKLISEPVLVRIMTRTDGVAALRALDAAKTPTAMRTALKALTTAAASSSAARRPATLRELRREAEQRRPAATY